MASALATGGDDITAVLRHSGSDNSTRFIRQCNSGAAFVHGAELAMSGVTQGLQFCFCVCICACKLRS